MQWPLPAEADRQYEYPADLGHAQADFSCCQRQAASGHTRGLEICHPPRLSKAHISSKRSLRQQPSTPPGRLQVMMKANALKHSRGETSWHGQGNVYPENSHPHV